MSEIDAGRLQRAIWLKIQPISGGYLVSGGASGHVVEVDGGRVTCHCPDAERMGDGCKHSLALRLRAGDGEVIDALRLLIPNPRHFPEKKGSRLGRKATNGESGGVEGGLNSGVPEVVS